METGLCIRPEWFSLFYGHPIPEVSTFKVRLKCKCLVCNAGPNRQPTASRGKGHLNFNRNRFLRFTKPYLLFISW